ncbi:exported hypothetical protein [Parafrankia sp. Ea1.12]|nr:exported hypothetical protein [Parafrankia sp. Ea1.12]
MTSSAISSASGASRNTISSSTVGAQVRVSTSRSPAGAPCPPTAAVVAVVAATPAAAGVASADGAAVAASSTAGIRTTSQPNVAAGAAAASRKAVRPSRPVSAGRAAARTRWATTAANTRHSARARSLRVPSVWPSGPHPLLVSSCHVAPAACCPAACRSPPDRDRPPDCRLAPPGNTARAGGTARAGRVPEHGSRAGGRAARRRPSRAAAGAAAPAGWAGRRRLQGRSQRSLRDRRSHRRCPAAATVPWPPGGRRERESRATILTQRHEWRAQAGVPKAPRPHSPTLSDRTWFNAPKPQVTVRSEAGAAGRDIRGGPPRADGRPEPLPSLRPADSSPRAIPNSECRPRWHDPDLTSKGWYLALSCHVL